MILDLNQERKVRKEAPITSKDNAAKDSKKASKSAVAVAAGGVMKKINAFPSVSLIPQL